MKINNFKELMNEIGYSWNYPNYDLIYIENEQLFIINKLYIKPDSVTYKTHNWELAPGVFEDMIKFYEFLKEVK